MTDDVTEEMVERAAKRAYEEWRTGADEEWGDLFQSERDECRKAVRIILSVVLPAAIAKARREALEGVLVKIHSEINEHACGFVGRAAVLRVLTSIRSMIDQPAQESDGWQTMETAPKDGSVVLGYWAGVQFTMVWRPGGYFAMQGLDIPDGAWTVQGIGLVALTHKGEPMLAEPTRWRPLHTPPKEADNGR